MDDHMLHRLLSEIELCFYCVYYAQSVDVKIKDTDDYKAAAVLIKAYNALVKLYYNTEVQEDYFLGNVAQEYKRYRRELEDLPL